MRIRFATESDLPAAMDIYAQARAFMEQTGNPTQWAGGYPQEDMLRGDIASSKLYVCEADDADPRIVAAFYFGIEPDDTYKVIEGAWLREGDYGVVHRIATARDTRGVGSFCLEWAYGQAVLRGATAGIRIDTHADNTPMRNLLVKLGYADCGVIYTFDGTPRIAFQKIPD